MSKASKIVQYGLEDEVRELIHNRGLSQDATAKHINLNHNDINVNAMTINRFLKCDAVAQIRDELKNDAQLEDVLRAEFRETMYDLDDEIHILLKKARKLLVQVEKSKNPIIQLRAINETTKIIEQCRKNWNTLIEQGYKKFGQVKEAKEQNYIEVNNMFITLSDKLCPTCRRKIVELITLKEEQ